MSRFLSKILSLTTVIALFLIGSCSFAAIPLNSSIAPMLQKVLPTIVNIRAQVKIADYETLRELQKERKNSSGKNGENNKNNDSDNEETGAFVSVGSGVIVDARKGYILTNAHVVTDAQTITITLKDGHHYTAKVIGMDKPSDIALLQIKAKNLSSLDISNSNDLQVGDFVAAIGNPFGLSQTVTSGIVSALGRTTLGIQNYENFIQTDAPINPGNSGGALINMKGQLVGINTAILTPVHGNIGIGFAIPSNMAKSVMMQLLEYGNVKRGMLGISIQNLTPELASAFHATNPQGAVVAQVLPNSPAKLAGIKVGDLITAINGIAIKTGNDVTNIIAFLRVNSKASITLMRKQKVMTVSVALAELKKSEQLSAAEDPFFFGVGLKNLSILSPVHGDVKGILVTSVQQDTNAWNANLHPGDIITSLNQQTVTNIQELKTLAATANKTVLLNILRGPSALFLVINKEQE